jgi:hypothetical protein
LSAHGAMAKASTRRARKNTENTEGDEYGPSSVRQSIFLFNCTPTEFV